MVRSRTRAVVPVVALVLLLVLLTIGGGTAHVAPSSSAPSSSVPSSALPTTRSPGVAGPTPAAQPAAGITLTAPGASAAAVSLSWTQVTPPFLGSFVNYTIAESNVSASGPFTTVSVVTTQTTTQFVHDDQLPGATYWWQVTGYVRSLTGTVTSSTSNVLAVAQANSSALTAWVISSSHVQLNWTDNETYGGLLAFQSFEVFEKNGSAGPFLNIRTISSPTTLSYNVTGLEAGTGYSFYVNTSDCLGPSCGSGVSVTTSDSVSGPTKLALGVTVSAALTTFDVGEANLLVCNAYGGSPPYAYEWEVNSTTFAPGNASRVVSFPTAGTKTVTCQVTDSYPTTVQAHTTLFVNPDAAVSITLNRTRADVGEPVSFGCRATAGTLPITLAWTFGDLDVLAGGSGSHAYTSNGTYVASCTATDGAGVSVSRAATVTVSPSLSLSVRANSSTAAPGTPLEFTGTARNGSGTYSNVTWDFGGRGSAVGATIAHSFPAPGAYAVTGSVTDSNGITTSSTTTVTVSPITVSEGAIPTAGTAGSRVTFSATASGGAGGPYNYTWSFGDGSVAYGATVNHTYASSGAYAPVLTVRDRLGATNVTAWPTLSVADPPSALAWLPLWVLAALGALVGAVIALVILTRLRASERAGAAALSSRWVPPVGPRGVVDGAKTCPACGASNSSLRRSCGVCGAPLPRAPA